MNGQPIMHVSRLNGVLILAPYRRDAEYMRTLLTSHDIDASIAADLHNLQEHIALPPGVLVATHEALKPAVIDTIGRHLANQPPWSEMPVVVLLDKSSSTEAIRLHLSQLWPRARLLFYHRPLKPIDLISGVQTGLLARQRQRDLQDNLEREVELRHELNHRVKNILASVTSIFEMTARQATSLETLKEKYRGRIGALASVHSSVFYASDEHVTLNSVTDLTFSPYQLTDSRRIVAGGPDVLLNREAATTLALCLHELATNAVKYGSLSVPEGHVELSWLLEGEVSSDLSFAWKERNGPSVQEPNHLGYGTRYVRSALNTLFGNPPNFSYNADGLTLTVTGKLSRLV